jgi:hypothetical protein
MINLLYSLDFLYIISSTHNILIIYSLNLKIYVIDSADRKRFDETGEVSCFLRIIGLLADNNHQKLKKKGTVRVVSRGEANRSASADIRQQTRPNEFGARKRNRRRLKPSHDPRPTVAHPSVLGSERRRSQGRP